MVKPFVLGLIEKEGKYLFLNRIDPPKVWSPPGGWLDKGENPEDGLLREIKEETALKVRIICPIHVFYKSKTNSLGFIYICRYMEGKVKISFEHKDFMWKTLKDLKAEKIHCSPSVKIFEKGQKILECLKKC